MSFTVFCTGKQNCDQDGDNEWERAACTGLAVALSIRLGQGWGEKIKMRNSVTVRNIKNRNLQEFIQIEVFVIETERKIWRICTVTN